MKKIIISFAVFLILVLVGGFLSIGWWKTNSAPVSNSGDVKRFIITKGASAEQVATDLHQAGLIKSPLAFKFYLQLRGDAGRIQAGEYDLSSSLSLKEIIEELKGGPNELWVTIPEGLRREEIPDRFISALGLVDSEAVVFKDDFLQASQGKEGRLFPDTYLVPKDVSGNRVVTLMSNNFENKIEELNIENSQLETVIIKASLIEREAKGADERPVIAGIINNRLALGMPLQIDATAQYALANQRCLNINNCTWWTLPTVDDLKVNSAFNTYQNTGLPPAPISNPGLLSIKAAAEPQETDYLFYIHDSEGNIYYAETLEEHNRNVSNYLN